MRHIDKAIAAGVAAAVAIPASAAAHPSVYVASAPVLAPVGLCSATGNTPPYTAAAYLATCVTQTRYVFTNHGNTFLLRESNGKTTGGAISYAHRPGGATGLAAATDYDVFAPAPTGPTTGAQPHATCDVPALTTPAIIRSWQGTDAFYAYVPFQRAAAGVDDDAADWIAAVRSATGVDLGAVDDTDAAREAACEALPGATASSYAPADATQSTKAAWASGPVGAAVAPLRAEIDTLRGEVAAKTTELAGVKGQLSHASAEIASLKAALTRLKLTFPATTPSLDALAADGLALRLTGPPGQTASVRLLVSATKLRRLGLRSRIVGATRVTLDESGRASLVLAPTRTAASALRRHVGKLSVLGEATTGDRRSLASAVFTG